MCSPLRLDSSCWRCRCGWRSRTMRMTPRRPRTALQMRRGLCGWRQSCCGKCTWGQRRSGRPTCRCLKHSWGGARLPADAFRMHMAMTRHRLPQQPMLTLHTSLAESCTKCGGWLWRRRCLRRCRSSARQTLRRQSTRRLPGRPRPGSSWRQTGSADCRRMQQAAHRSTPSIGRWRWESPTHLLMRTRCRLL